MRAPLITAQHNDRAHSALPSHLIARYVIAALVGWFAIVVSLGFGGAFARPPGEAPYPIAIGVTAPIAICIIAFWRSAPFRAFVASLDLALITIVQAWRFVGSAFLGFYAYGIVSGAFAWPAALGDVAIAVTAPWVGLAILRRPAFAGSRLFVAWNALGILDFVIAVITGAMTATLGLYGPPGALASPLSQMPLVLIPTFLVPVFTMLHLVAIFQSQLTRRGQFEREATVEPHVLR